MLLRLNRYFVLNVFKAIIVQRWERYLNSYFIIEWFILVVIVVRDRRRRFIMHDDFYWVYGLGYWVLSILMFCCWLFIYGRCRTLGLIIGFLCTCGISVRVGVGLGRGSGDLLGCRCLLWLLRITGRRWVWFWRILFCRLFFISWWQFMVFFVIDRDCWRFSWGWWVRRIYFIFWVIGRWGLDCVVDISLFLCDVRSGCLVVFWYNLFWLIFNGWLSRF